MTQIENFGYAESRVSESDGVFGKPRISAASFALCSSQIRQDLCFAGIVPELFDFKFGENDARARSQVGP